MFQERDGDNRPWPEYPFKVEDLYKLIEVEREHAERVMEKAAKSNQMKMSAQVAADNAVNLGEADNSATSEYLGDADNATSEHSGDM